MPAPALADAILYNFTHTGTFSEAREDRRIGGMALDHINRDNVKAEFYRVWSHAGQPLIIVVSPSAVSREDIRRVWTEANAGAPPPAPTDVATAAWAYETFGPPGTLISREVVGSPNFVRMEFSNGVRLNFKQTQNAADRVEIRIRFGAGDQELPAADVPIARIGSSVFALMGTGRNSIEDISRVCQGRLCDIRLDVDRDVFTLRSTTRAADLDLDLQILTAYLTDPGFRPTVDNRMPTEAENLFRVGRTDPNFVATLAREAAMARPHASPYPTQEAMAAMRAEDFRRVLGPIVTRDALEVTIIGDVREDRAVQAMLATLGAIPRRERADRTRADAPFSRFPRPMVAPIRLTHEGPPDRALVSFTWPLFVWTPERSREAKVIDLLTLLVSNELTTDLRERLGAAYSPRAVSRLERGNDDGAFFVEITTNPGQAEQVNQEIRSIAQRFANGDFTQEDLERARRPLLDYGATRQLGNEWWIETLTGSWRNPDQLIIANRWSDYSAITLDEVKTAARRYLAQDPLVIIVLPRTPQR
jgi:zinc protease